MAEPTLTQLGPITSEDFAAIREATTRAEAGTSGEVVVYVTARSDPYPEARWMAATAFMLLAIAIASVFHARGDFWGGSLLMWWIVPAMVGALIGYCFGLWKVTARLFLNQAIVELRTRRRAEVAFLDEEVFCTRDRTGILLFISLLEHRALVLADSGIHARVDPDEWTKITEAVARGIAESRAGEAIVDAVHHCGRLLAASGLERRDDDRNELVDEPRFRHE